MTPPVPRTRTPNLGPPPILAHAGKLSFVMVGIIYTTSKSDDDEGLAFGQFLDSMVSLAFECECNVAGTLQAEWDKKDVLGKNSAAAQVRGLGGMCVRRTALVGGQCRREGRVAPVLSWGRRTDAVQCCVQRERW